VHLSWAERHADGAPSTFWSRQRPPRRLCLRTRGTPTASAICKASSR